MSTVVQRTWASYRRLPSWTTPVLLIVVVVLAGNALYVSGLSNNDPISWTAEISRSVCHISCGRPSIDPNVGALTQSLGYRAAVDLLHGHFPWWNYFEGLGQPLAGEMQSAALFPFTLLLALPGGLVWLHVVLEALAGISTYFFARRLSIPVLAATVGGMLFALNGTFAWIANAVVNPLPFLPLLLLGIEIIVDRANSDSRRSWYPAAVALALSLYSGFPEGAFFQAIFCAVWAIIRVYSIPTEVRLRALRRLGLAAGVGVALALPLLVPFYDFLKVAFVGAHSNAVLGQSHLPASAIPMFFNPYLYGTIFDNPHAATLWDNVGGYFTVSVAILALVGLFGSRLRPLRIFLALWFVVGLSGAFNFLHARMLWNLIPLVDTSAFARYIVSSCDFALIVLAVLGLSELAQSTRTKRLFSASAIFMGVVVLSGYLTGRNIIDSGVAHSTKVRIFLFALTLVPVIAVVALVVLGRVIRFKWTPLLIAVVMVGESLFLFAVPTVQTPKILTIDYAPIDYLQTHQGQERFLDLHVLLPNWGSQFGLNSLSAIDLPFPDAFRTFIQRHLYPGLKPANEFLVKNGTVLLAAQEAELAAHFKSYEKASVKYLLAPRSLTLIPRLTALGVKPVFHDADTTIYELPHPRSFFTSSCSIKSPNDDLAYADCGSSGATLLRTELSMKGWSVTVNGRPVTVTTISGVYQRVDLPAGKSVVRYSFLPPHEHPALAIGTVALVFLVGSWILEVRPALVPRRRRRREPVKVTDD
jgi:hypothetical protein